MRVRLGIGRFCTADHAKGLLGAETIMRYWDF